MYKSGDDKAKYVHDVFESIAKNYDKMNSIISFNLHKRWRKYAVSKVNSFTPDLHVLDVCCGTADWSIDLASRGNSVIGVDFSKKMLEVGKSKIENLGLSDKVDLLHGDTMSLPFKDNSFDLVTIGFGLRNVKDYIGALMEMKRVVKPGGRVVSLEVFKPMRHPYKVPYFLYYKYGLPILGTLFANKKEEYGWLKSSIMSFPNYMELEKDMKKAVKFKNVNAYPLFGGVITVHVCEVH